MNRPVLELIRDCAHALYGWAVLIAAALLGFRLSEGTTHHQLAVGVLISSVTLFVLLTLLELLSRAIVDWRPKQNDASHGSDIDGKV